MLHGPPLGQINSGTRRVDSTPGVWQGGSLRKEGPTTLKGGGGGRRGRAAPQVSLPPSEMPGVVSSGPCHVQQGSQRGPQHRGHLRPII